MKRIPILLFFVSSVFSCLLASCSAIPGLPSASSPSPSPVGAVATTATATDAPAQSDASPVPARYVILYLNDQSITLSPPARFDDFGKTIIPATELVKLGLTVTINGNAVTLSNGEPPITTTDTITVDGALYVPLRYIIDNYAPDFRWDPDTRSAYLYMAANAPTTP